MMWWKQYTLSIIGCALLSGIVTHIVSELRYKKLIQLVSGMLLAVTILNPFSTADLGNSLEWDLDSISPEEYVDAGKQAALCEQEKCIRTACESYISNKAKALGMVATIEIVLDDQMQPCSASLYVQSDSECRKRLEQILEEDLGVTKENQVWIWNQGENSS